MLPIGVLGAGHLGAIHIDLLWHSQRYALRGLYEPDPDKAQNIQYQYGITAFPSYEALLEAVSVVDIVTPTLSHYECAMQALARDKHLFIEKPVTETTAEAKALKDEVAKRKVKAQVGHVERYNPAFVGALSYGLSPAFIESHRLAPFQPRGTDVSVILDLMIHDIDIVLSLIPAPVSYISASGVNVISDNPDIASARIEFDNGAVSNLTASRMSLKKERKMRIFQRSAYVTVDFYNKKTNVFKMREKDELSPDNPYQMEINPGDGQPSKVISYESPDVKETNAIQQELEALADAIELDQEPEVTVYDGYASLSLAHEILEKIKTRSAVHAM
jgi:predicted dehydrogenase